MANLSITRLGHGGVLYRSPGDAWIWVDRWSGSPNHAKAYLAPEKVSVVAPTHCHFDHVGDDCADLVELARFDGAAVIGSHEMCVWLGGRGIEATGMNKGGTVETAASASPWSMPTTPVGQPSARVVIRSLATSALGAG